MIDNLEISNLSTILDFSQSGEEVALLAEFKLALNSYLSELTYSPVRSLADVIAFNIEHSVEVSVAQTNTHTYLLNTC